MSVDARREAGTEWPTPCRSCRGTGDSGNLHDELCPDCAGSRLEHLQDEAADAKRDERAMREYDPAREAAEDRADGWDA